jgi:hypothetical protein
MNLRSCNLFGQLLRLFLHQFQCRRKGKATSYV